MPSIIDLLDQLKEAGVLISGEALLVQKAADAEYWPGVVLTQSLVGRNAGIRFERVSPMEPSNEQLLAILRGYPFEPQEAKTFVDNVMTVSSTILVASSGPARSVLDRLTADERVELDTWSKTAERSSTGAVNLMEWPGWAQVHERIQQSGFAG
ncbi:hypothetical protein [Paraburkholderia sp. SIMBA_054]|uniref:hypothetical protein n=1 Tax=Paraburkholderia sp. SIMBA_054 TaxID=3085795 RepID=UPI003979EB86